MRRTQTSASEAPTWRWRPSVEFTWLATTALLIITALVEPDWLTGCFAAFFALFGGHYLRGGRAFHSRMYMTSAGLMVLVPVLTGIAFWEEPSRGVVDLLLASTVFAFVVFAAAQSLRPIILAEETTALTVALDDPQTRRSHRRYTTSSYLLLLVSLGLLAGFVAGAIVSDERQTRIEADGIPTKGTVARLEGNRLLGGGAVVVTFDFEGQTRTEEIQLNDDSPRYEVGQTVELLVDSNDQTRVSLRGEYSDPLLLVVLTIIGLIAGFVAFAAAMARFANLARQQQLLNTTDWRNVHIKYKTSGEWQDSLHLLRITDGSDVHLVSISETFWMMLPDKEQQTDQIVQLVGDCKPHGIVKLRDSNRLWHVWLEEPDTGSGLDVTP